MNEITCPSGLRGVLREMKVKDEQLFTDRKLVRTGRAVGALLEACWEQTTDFGPYSDEGQFDWDQVASVDRTYAVVQLRMLSYGEKYEFNVTCSACREPFSWEVNLNDLAVAPVSKQGIAHLKDGKPIQVEMPDGKTLHCRITTGEDERFLQKRGASEESKLLTYQLVRRIVQMDGLTTFPQIVTALEDMPASHADYLWNETDYHEGGIDTAFDVQCESCGSIQQVFLPFEAAFFSNRDRFARTRKRRTG
jgi:hypothetical protein